MALTRKKVLFFAPVPNFKGGAERSLFDLMANPAIEPSLIVPEAGPLSEAAAKLGIPTHVVSFGKVETIRRPFRLGDGLGAGRDALNAARRVKEIARQTEASLVHSNGLKAHAIAILSRFLGGAPCVVHIRDIANTGLEKRVWQAMQTGASHMVLVSNACWPFGRPFPANVTTVYNGTELGKLGSAAEPIPGEPVRIGFAGRIHPHKGLHVLLDAVAIAVRSGADVKLSVRGEFAGETPDYKAEILSQIERLNIGDRVTFEGFVSDPALVYRDVNLVCVPSTLPDPLPRAVMEAMGLGLVVIAAPVGGIPEMIDHGVDGFLALTPDDIARNIVNVVNDGDQRRQMSARAKAKFQEKFTMDALHRNITSVYTRVLSK